MDQSWKNQRKTKSHNTPADEKYGKALTLRKPQFFNHGKSRNPQTQISEFQQMGKMEKGLTLSKPQLFNHGEDRNPQTHRKKALLSKGFNGITFNHSGYQLIKAIMKKLRRKVIGDRQMSSVSVWRQSSFAEEMVWLKCPWRT